MSLLLHTFNPKPFTPLSALNPNPSFHPFSIFLPQNLTLNPNPLHPSFFISSSRNHIPKPLPLFAVSSSSSSSSQDPNPNPNFKRKIKSRRSKPKIPEDVVENSTQVFPTTIPRKPRRGRKSEAAAVEDFIRNSLERTFESIREQNSEILEDKEKVLKDKIDDEVVNEDDDEVMKGKKAVVEEDDPNWPLDADVGWGTRASEYFDNHPIKNVVGEDGVEIDWEGELDDSWVKEINCLEWESFAFHPSPLIVLVFERYNRASDNWKVLKELEKAIKVYWNAKDRLPPRAVKIDINIERDLAYALKVKEGPQLLFLRGNRIMYREKEIRTTDELVHMIAYFYYNAKKPSWIDDAALAPY